jgi:hypothetical protein
MRLAMTLLAPTPEGLPLLDRPTPAQKARFPCPASSDNVFANEGY